MYILVYTIVERVALLARCYLRLSYKHNTIRNQD